jgi:NitT/TauT family transport system permease protein
LPSPQALAHELYSLIITGYTGKPLWAHALASLIRTLVGLIAALLVGIPVGLLMGASRVAGALLTPPFSFLRPVPAIALIPLIILYFGIGEFSKIFVIFITASLYIILNAAAGVKSVPQDLIRAGINMGLSRRQLFTHVILPASAPYIMTGIKTATAVSWALVVASELIAAQVGLGYVIMDAATFYRIPDVYIAIAIIGLIGLALETLETYAENRLLHWRGK